MLSKKDKQGLWVMAGVFAILLSVFGIKLSQESKPKPGPDFCVGEVTDNTVVLIDHTERISDQTGDSIVDRTLSHLSKHVKENERVSVFTISDDSKKSLRPIVSLCRPPSDGNRMVEDVQGIRKRFQRDFEGPIKLALQKAPENTKESPIAQAITDISLSQYLRGKSNSLLIYSDMLENTKQFTLYKCQSSSDVINRYRASRSGAKERPDFTNTKVYLNFIPRLDQSPNTLKCRDAFWPWFFGNNSGSGASLNIDYLPGGAAGVDHARAPQ